jgi:hypothetical protein
LEFTWRARRTQRAQRKTEEVQESKVEKWKEEGGEGTKIRDLYRALPSAALRASGMREARLKVESQKFKVSSE